MIRLKNVSRTYTMGSVEVHALRNVTLSIEPGEFVALMGPSGSGKSTLLHILGFLDRPDEGEYFFHGRDVTEFSDDQLALIRNRLAGFVFQQFHLLPRMTALGNAELPLIYAGDREGLGKAREALDSVGLADRVHHRPVELSGGEQQRVAIARSLVNAPPVILADEPTGNLDSRSGAEIISILSDLNRSGKTILMVTHEQELAACAGRIIRMRDGEIVSDETTGTASSGGRDQDADETVIDEIISGSHSVFRRAELADHVRQACGGILAHKLRSFLSMLGILIGVGAVIAMMAIGRGAKESITERLASLGSNMLSIRPASRRAGGVALAAGTVTRLSIEDADAIGQISLLNRYSPIVGGGVHLVHGNRNWSSYATGTGADYAQMRAVVPDIGRYFTEEEVAARAKVAIIGRTVVSELFGEGVNPLGKTIRVKMANFQVIGVSPEKGASHWRDYDDVVYIPYTTAMYRLFGRKYLRAVEVEVVSHDRLEQAQEAITELLRKRHHLKPSDEEQVNIRNMAEFREMLESTTKTMSLLLGVIAAISLLVGGIGIMNIMLVSVTERTREIGLRKAIGARRADIMAQFLIEAIVLTILGGAVGVGTGCGAAGLVTYFAEWPVSISALSIVLGVGFSVVIGILFGLWPACKAARLSPIEALRYE